MPKTSPNVHFKCHLSTGYLPYLARFRRVGFDGFDRQSSRHLSPILLRLSVSLSEDCGALSEKTNSQWQPLLEAAQSAMKNAHAPYSNFKVGAAIRTTSGKIFSGCNVENASYGMTNCAERTAIFSAVAEVGSSIEIAEIAVVCEQNVPCAPCGACRQVIYEFGPKAVVYFQSASGWKPMAITDLLPEGFRLK